MEWLKEAGKTLCFPRPLAALGYSPNRAQTPARVGWEGPLTTPGPGHPLMSALWTSEATRGPECPTGLFSRNRVAFG